MIPEETAPAVGQPTPLMDGAAKITGNTRFVADLKLHGVLTAQLVQSDFAHANIRSIDTSEALKVEGVVAVLTADDMPDIAPEDRAKLLLAKDRAIFFGQPVAIVLATSEYAAADGADRVMVDYEPLPVAIDLETAMADGAPLVWPNGVPGSGNSDAGDHGLGAVGEVELEPAKLSNIVEDDTSTQGDPEAAFAEAAYVVEHTFTTPIVHQGAIETHGVIVQPNPMTGGVTIWSPNQGPFSVRREVAEVLGVSESDVRVIVPPVGGGFGGKSGMYDALIAVAAVKLKRPVQLILSRMNELSATNPAPRFRIKAKLGCDADGKITALSAHLITDSGIFPSWYSKAIGYSIRSMYRIPAYEVRTTNVLTHTPSVTAYRAPGAPSVVFVMDTLLEEIGRLSGISSEQMRLNNNRQTGDMLPFGRPMPPVGFTETLEAITSHPIWQNREQLREEGYGVGLAIGAWFGAVEPGVATCQLERDGTVHIHVGSVDLTGTNTTFAMLAADTFGVAPDKVRVHYGDTESGPYGGTTAGSRTTYSFAPAIVNAATEARRQMLEIAGEQFEVAVEDLEVNDGVVSVKGLPSKSISIADIAKSTMKFGGKHAPVHAQGRAAMRAPSPGYNAQLVQVKVDEETGMVEIIKHVAAQDVGKAINPMAVKGQIMGGAVQGLGWALYEEIVYDDQTGQLLSGTLMDYNLPSGLQSGHDFEAIIVEVPSPLGFMGMRGVGEPPIVPTAAAVANAIAHATGARLTDLPMTAPRVLKALQERE